MKPSNRYEEFLSQTGYVKDAAQQHALVLLDGLHENLKQQTDKSLEKTSLVSSLFKKFSPPEQQITGLYFWGGVGTGKTFIMDIFFESLPFKEKKRFHFHHFMQIIHDSLGKTVNKQEPLKEIAEQFVQDTRVLCLDEFVVTDIGDAMLIGRLLTALFSKGIILVTTSNTPPEDLYKEGLQRARFLPAIDLVIQHCQVSQLDGGTDYRSLALSQTQLYQYPHDEKALNNVQEYVQNHLLSGSKDGAISIKGRDIRYEYCAESTVWFTFDQLCKTTRSRFDYLELARDFETMVLTEIDVMNDQTNDITRRFISLIDVLYDHRVKLICTAETDVLNLYQGAFLEFEFRRTISRLLEMQAQSYVAKSHIG